MTSVERTEVRIQVLKVLTSATYGNDGQFYIRLAKKVGQYGEFYSLDRGKMAEIEGSDKLVAVKPDRFISLPSNPEVLDNLGRALVKLAKTLKEIETTEAGLGNQGTLRAGT